MNENMEKDTITRFDFFRLGIVSKFKYIFLIFSAWCMQMRNLTDLIQLSI